MPTMQQWSERSTTEIKRRMDVVLDRRGNSQQEISRLREALKIAQQREKDQHLPVG